MYTEDSENRRAGQAGSLPLGQQGNNQHPSQKEVGHELIRKLLLRLKRVTLIVQIIPFAYTLIHIFVYGMYFSDNEELLWYLDTMFYVSPVIILAFLILSYNLGLCKWHRTACILPLVSQIPVFVDKYVVPLDNVEISTFLAAIITMSILLLIAAYKVFFCK